MESDSNAVLACVSVCASHRHCLRRSVWLGSYSSLNFVESRHEPFCKLFATGKRRIYVTVAARIERRWLSDLPFPSAAFQQHRPRSRVHRSAVVASHPCIGPDHLLPFHFNQILSKHSSFGARSTDSLRALGSPGSNGSPKPTRRYTAGRSRLPNTVFVVG